MNPQNPNWQRLNFDVLPTPRIGCSLLRRPKNRKLMLFGGISPSQGNLNDLWIVGNRGWERIDSGVLPSGRRFMSLVYDESRETAILFGGIENGGKLPEDTWSFDGSIWTKRETSTSPTPRTNASMAYDAARKVTVLFGGKTRQGRLTVEMDDTWIWDGSDWLQLFLNKSPKPRGGASMVFDAKLQAVILFGGDSQGGFLSDTWIWDGSSWIEQHPTHHPSGRTNAGMAYHAANQQIMLFGGQRSEGAINDTWIWDGQDWALLQTMASPPIESAFYPNLDYDPIRQTIMLYTAIEVKKDRPEDLVAQSEVWALI